MEHLREIADAKPPPTAAEVHESKKAYYQLPFNPPQFYLYAARQTGCPVFFVLNMR